MWHLLESNNRCCSRLAGVHTALPALQPLFQGEATAVRAGAKPRGTSSGAQLSDLIRSRAEFRSHSPHLHPPPPAENTANTGGRLHWH